MSYPWHYLVMAMLYILAGVAHWRFPRIYLKILPGWVPWKHAVVWTSGLLEVLLGIFLFFPAYEKMALLGIMLMLIAFLPVHLYMIRVAGRFPKIPEWLLWLRIPLQGALIAWAYAYL